MIVLTKRQKEVMLEDFKNDGKCNIFGVVTIEIKPARKGKLVTPFGGKQMYKQRLAYKSSRELKKRVLKKAN